MLLLIFAPHITLHYLHIAITPNLPHTPFDMPEIGEIAVFVGKILVSILAYAFTAAINTFQYCNVQFPTATNYVTLAVLVYVAYKFIRRMIRVWIRLIYSLIKIAFFGTLALVCFAIYLRGFHRFFTRDIYGIKAWFQSSGAGPVDWAHYAQKYALILSAPNKDFDFLKKSALDWVANNKENIDRFEEQLYRAKDVAGDYLSQNMDETKEYLHKNGFDINPEAVQNILNNLRF